MVELPRTKWSGPLKCVARDELSRLPIDATSCDVYMVYETSGQLAYVGITGHFRSRWRQHEKFSFWLNEISLDHVSVRTYRSRADAAHVEAAAIRDLTPKYNTRLEHAVPGRRRRPKVYRVERYEPSAWVF